MYTILYKDTKKLQARSGTDYSTEYYNGISLRNKKGLQKYCKNVIDIVDELCREESDAIRYFHDTKGNFRRDTYNSHSKQAHKGNKRTPYEALTEFYDYITLDNPTGGIPGQMINRWNRVFKDQLEKYLITVQKDHTVYMSRRMEPHYDQLKTLFDTGEINNW